MSMSAEQFHELRHSLRCLAKTRPAATADLCAKILLRCYHHAADSAEREAVACAIAYVNGDGTRLVLADLARQALEPEVP